MYYGASMFRPLYLLLIGVMFLYVAACGDAASDANAIREAEPGFGADSDYYDDSGTGWIDGDYSSEMDYNPGEEDEVLKLSPPVIGKDYVFILNRTYDTVVAVKSSSWKISTFKVGMGPRILATVPGKDVALILCHNSDELYILDMTSDSPRIMSWPLARRNFVGYNDIRITPSGKFAILFFNYRLMELGDNLGALQEVAVVDLQHIESLSEDVVPFVKRPVSLNPTDVFFDSLGRHAIVITDYGLNVIDLQNLSQPVVGPVSFGDTPQDARSREVLITPDGMFALVRWSNKNLIAMLDIQTGSITEFPLEGSISDIDLSADGSKLFAVEREVGKLLVISVPDGFASPDDPNFVREIPLTHFEGQITLSPDGNKAVLFTNANTDVESVTVLDVATGETSLVPLTKSVRDVVFSPTGDRALIIHSKKPGAIGNITDIEERIDHSYGYSLLGMENGSLVLNLSLADISRFVFTPDSKKLYLLVTDGSSVRQVHVVDLSDPQGAYVEIVSLGSVPEEIGVMPLVRRTYVSQAYSTGRITFFDWDSSDMITITGFQMNSEIE